MAKRVFIIHGWEGSPKSNWFPWLKKELEAKGFFVSVPEMPDTMRPTLNKWFTHLEKIVGEPDENTYFVGHSLGVITILKYLESLPANKKVGGVVAVAGFPESISYEELNSFFATPLDYQKIKIRVDKIIAINSNNDPYVPVRNGEILRDKLGAKLVVMKNGGHLNEGFGFTSLPVVLESLLEIAGKNIKEKIYVR